MVTRKIITRVNSIQIRHLPDAYPILNTPKQNNAMTPSLFNFSLEYTIKKV
jgi:hypothetical protein